MLAEVPDPCNKKGKRHSLKSILALVVIGLMCGHKGWTSIATWARSQPTLAKICARVRKHTRFNMVGQVLIRQKHPLNAYSLDGADIGQ